MIARRNVIQFAAFFAALPSGAHAQAQRLPVAATFPILGDFAREIGGERIALTLLVQAGVDTHGFQPAPDDSKKLAAAKLIIANGLGFEGFLDRLIKASGTKAAVVLATKGADIMAAAGAGHGHGGSDPHAWQSVGNAKVYVANIRDALAAADPAGKDVFNANAAAYLGKLDALDAEIRAAIAKIPAGRRSIVTDHNAFRYFERDYGLKFFALRGLSTATEASARDVAKTIRDVRASKATAIFVEEMTNPKTLERIAAESGVKLAGTLYSDTLTPEPGPAPSYIAMMRANLAALVKGLAP